MNHVGTMKNTQVQHSPCFKPAGAINEYESRRNLPSQQKAESGGCVAAPSILLGAGWEPGLISDTESCPGNNKKEEIQ